jgi:hypothetical protein
VKLSDIESLELVDRRGYLTITISQLREGKIFLRTTQGLQDWYNVIQASMGGGYFPTRIQNMLWRSQNDCLSAGKLGNRAL